MLESRDRRKKRKEMQLFNFFSLNAFLPKIKYSLSAFQKRSLDVSAKNIKVTVKVFDSYTKRQFFNLKKTVVLKMNRAIMSRPSKTRLLFNYIFVISCE